MVKQLLNYRWKGHAVPARAPGWLAPRVARAHGGSRGAPRAVGSVSCASMSLTPFHIAVQVRDLAEARRFYGEVLGCAEGRSAPEWVDFNLYGHQFVCHLNRSLGPHGRISSHFNPVDGHGVPVPHCGVVLGVAEWRELAARLKR